MKLTLICGKTCGPCKQLLEYLDDCAPACEIEHIYGEDHMDMCRELKIARVPTLVVYNDEGVEETISGKDEILVWLNNHEII